MLVYAGVAVFTGNGVLVLGLVAVVAWGLSGENSLIAVALVGGFLAVGIARARGVAAAAGSGLLRPDSIADRWQPSRRGALVSGLLSAPVFYLAFRTSLMAWAVLAVVGFVCVLAVMMISSRAALYREDLRLVDDQRDVSLTGVVRPRRLAVGPVVAYWLTYARGSVGWNAPRFFVVPRDLASDVDRVLDAAVAAEADADPLGRGERAIVVGFGVGMLAIAPALWALLPPTGDGRLLAAYIGIVTVPVSIPVLWYAITG